MGRRGPRYNDAKSFLDTCKLLLVKLKMILPTALKRDLKVLNIMFDSNEDLLELQIMAQDRFLWEKNFCFQFLFFNLTQKEKLFKNNNIC